MLNDWSHKVRAILKKYCPGNIKKYCPLHKARGIHDFILATKSSVWIIILVTQQSKRRRPKGPNTECMVKRRDKMK